MMTENQVKDYREAIKKIQAKYKDNTDLYNENMTRIYDGQLQAIEFILKYNQKAPHRSL